MSGAYFTNTTYTALSMLNGDGFAKQFGGASGTDADWYNITIEGLLERTREFNAKVGYATVYRTLKLLTECGLAAARKFGEGSAVFEIRQRPQH